MARVRALACGGGTAPRRYGLAWDLICLFTVPLRYSACAHENPSVRAGPVCAEIVRRGVSDVCAHGDAKWGRARSSVVLCMLVLALANARRLTPPKWHTILYRLGSMPLEHALEPAGRRLSRLLDRRECDAARRAPEPHRTVAIAMSVTPWTDGAAAIGRRYSR